MPSAPLGQGCHLLSLVLEELGIACAALHSHKPQRARLAALDRFKGGAVPILLATDVASRGLDIPTVDLVVNYDLPLMARDYVHRWVWGVRVLGWGGAGLSGFCCQPCPGVAGWVGPERLLWLMLSGPAFALACPCRVGRTARAGRRGWSLSFVTQYDIELVKKVGGAVLPCCVLCFSHSWAEPQAELVANVPGLALSGLHATGPTAQSAWC